MERNIKRVRHIKWGEGTVLMTRHKGFQALVVFDREKMPRWVRMDELEILEGTIIPPTPIFPPVKGKKEKDRKFKARRMIEAFRLGVVPMDCVEEFIFGRDKELATVYDWLQDEDKRLLYICGEYGAGKTHLLNAIFYRALKEGFAVALVELDPAEVPLHSPKKVYNRIVQSLRYISQGTDNPKGFREFLREAFQKGAFNDHSYFKYVLDHLGTKSEHAIWEWIECWEKIEYPVAWNVDNVGPYTLIFSDSPPLYDFQTAANIYCYLLSGLGWASVNVLGLKGLLLLFDEAESIDMVAYKRQFEKGLNFFKALKRVAENDKELKNLPSPSMGLDYCGKSSASQIPFLYKIPCGLKLIFTFTQVQEQIPEAIALTLDNLPTDALERISAHIHQLYIDAYETEVQPPPSSFYLRSHSNIRGFVKRCVEVLDLARLEKGV